MEKKYFYNMPLTLERHFEELAQTYSNVRELYSIWTLLRKKIEDRMNYSRSVFVNYSLHDATHSRSILQAIERFLGDERISRLSATDTFMLLTCAYAHDYGMSLTFDQIYTVLGSEAFLSYIDKEENQKEFLENEDAYAVHSLFRYIHEEKNELKVSEIYFCIMLVLQSYLRQQHWKGIKAIEKEMQKLFEGNIKGRFVYGLEGIVEICMCHGQTIKELLELRQIADGIVGDDYHPRFVAAMLRLGDLLDLDNGRFPIWFVKEVAANASLIPEVSKLHYLKHEAVAHLLITPKKIEVVAKCYSKNNGYKVAGLVNEWTYWLKEECKMLVQKWDEIAPPDFGRPPSDVKVEIFVDDSSYSVEGKNFQMKMSQERVMNLLEGTSIYRDKYVGIREMIQNAIDASLLQMWSDIVQNRYCAYGITKDVAKNGMDLVDFAKDGRDAIFGNYDISIEVIQNKKTESVMVVVKDKGIGIQEEEVRYIADIGSSKEKNERVQGLMKTMPKWLKPAGFFGIGLQSVFQLTDCIKFYTRQHNMPEKEISLYSYGGNHGRVEVHDIPHYDDEVFKDNSIPGTSVTITINPRKLLGEKGTAIGNHCIYYDPEFDKGQELDMVFVEVAKACAEKISEAKYDYFNIHYVNMKIDENGKVVSENVEKNRRKSFFYRTEEEKRNKAKQADFGKSINTFCENESPQPYRFNENEACYWDKDSCRLYHISVRPCIIRKDDDRISLPDRVPDLYNIQYKFSSISDTTSVYQLHGRFGQQHMDYLHMDVLIMDDQVTRYLNIDRDRLRDRAVAQKELLDVQTKILGEWCRQICCNDTPNKKISLKLETFAALALVFYQNVPGELFEKFLRENEKNIESINEKKFTFNGDEMKFTDLWNPEISFCVRREDIPIQKDKVLSVEDGPRDNIISISLKDLSRLPDRMIYMESITYEGAGALEYRFRLRGPGGETEGIQMSETARLYDYLMVYDTYKEVPRHIDFQSVQKKVFKPDNKYPDLILNCYPHTFHRGRNFETDIDYMLERYILSPFDQDACTKMSKLIYDGTGDKNEIFNLVEKSQQLEKCVNYVFNKRFAAVTEPERKKEEIRSAYKDFIRNFLETLYNNKDLFKNYVENEQ